MRKLSHITRRTKAALGLSMTLAFLLFVTGSLVRRVAAQGSGESEAEAQYRSAMESADHQIWGEIHAHSELMKNLEYLTTYIGARLTGSPQMQAASQWTLKRFQDYHVDAHLETAQIPHAWTRGVDTAEILSPIQRRIEIRSMGWSMATTGSVTAPVVVLDSLTPEAIATMGSKLKGAIALQGAPTTLPLDSEPPENAYDAVIPPQRGVPAGGGGAGGGGRGANANQPLIDAGVALILRDSGKTDNLFNMGSGGRGFVPSPLPMAFLTHEDYSLIYRLAQTGPVTLKTSLNGTFSASPADASITVAEIKGSEFPDERVIIGGHLDSWDLGQGALDNGTGAMSVLEAARALQALGWKPKRTITFILFVGEEQGGIGVQTFLKNHAAEIPKMDGVLVDDTGTGRIFSIALENLYETAPLMTQVYRPIQEVMNIQPLSTRYFGSSDHVAFLNAGVPAYFCIQEPAHYREAHHSETDTFDKVIPDQVNQGAAVIAAWAWNLSELPQPLPHHSVAPAGPAPPGR